jgi:hypothetical protein
MTTGLSVGAGESRNASLYAPHAWAATHVRHRWSAATASTSLSRLLCVG